MIILTDIHGNFDTMIALLGMIPQEEKDKGIAICGDLIDRGPKSKEIVQWCIDNNITVLRGNHEEMMLDEFDEIEAHMRQVGYPPPPGRGSLWTLNGGYETLESYMDIDESITDDRGVPKKVFDFETFKKHAEWMAELPYFKEYPDLKNKDGRYLVLSHSNIAPVWDKREMKTARDEGQFKRMVTWGRPNKIKDISEIFNVIGHTPQRLGARYRKTFANIDTGCFYTHEPGYGRLTALQFPEMIFYEHENIDVKKTDNPFKNVLSVEDLKVRKKVKKC